MGPEPWRSHCPKNVDWSTAVLDECCRRRATCSTVVLFGRRVSRLPCGGPRRVVPAPPDKNSFSSSACGVRRVACCGLRRVLPPRVACWLVCVCSWDSDHPKLLAVGSEPWSSHCPKNVDWSTPVHDECCRPRVVCSTVVLVSRRVMAVRGWSSRVPTCVPPNKNSFRRSTCCVRRGACCGFRRVLPPAGTGVDRRSSRSVRSSFSGAHCFVTIAPPNKNSFSRSACGVSRDT